LKIFNNAKEEFLKENYDIFIKKNVDLKFWFKEFFKENFFSVLFEKFAVKFVY